MLVLEPDTRRHDAVLMSHVGRDVTDQKGGSVFKSGAGTICFCLVVSQEEEEEDDDDGG